LKESERRYKTLFDSSPDLIIETDEKGNILAFNSMMTKSIGAPSEKLIGKNIFEIFPREIAEERAKIARKALEEMKIQERDNEWAGRYFHNIYAPIVHPDGKKTIQLITRDETLQKKVEEELRYLKEYNENILESNPNPIMVVKGTQIEYVNKSFVFIFGETKNKYIARNLKDVIPSEIFPVFENLLQEDGRSKELKFRGKEFIVHSFVVKKTEEEETRRGMVFQDISELKRAEDARRFNEEKLRKVIDSSPDNITVSDLNGNIIDCNQATVDMHGFSTKEEIIGKNALELIAPKDHEKAMEQLKKTLDVGSVKNVEYTFLKKDGSEFPAEISASVIKDSSGKPVSFIGVIKDISERKRAEQLLKESEEKFRTIFDNSTEGILLADMENKKFFTGNKAICSMLGYNLEEIKNLDVSEIHPKEDLQFVVEQFEKQVRKEIILAKNIPVKRKNGSIFYTDINSAPTTIAGKTYLMGSFRDVTERKQAEEALKKSENRYRASIELTHLLAWTTSDSGEVVEDIPIWRKFTGQSYEEVKGIGWTKAIHPDDLEQTIRLWKKAVETKNTYEIEYRVRRDDGVFRSFLTRGIPILKEDGRIKEWVGICIDITERKKIEKELKESEEKYRNVVERASDGIVIVQDMIVKYVNPRVFEILGYKPSEIIGASMTDYIHPDELPNVIEHYKRRMAGDSVPRSYESMLVRRDGRVIYVELSGRDIVYQGQPADMIMVHDITDRKKVENNLKEKIDELERFKKLTIERELKMIELKIQIRKLEENLKELAPPDQKFKENLME
jgi:PAS domain S-box-containing protein